MGRGIDLARASAPIHAEVLDDLKDQLLIAFVRRLGGKVDMPVAEIDRTGESVMTFHVDPETRIFHFQVQAKQ
jgi:hypothetical protein